MARLPITIAPTPSAASVNQEDPLASAALAGTFFGKWFVSVVRASVIAI